MNYVIENGNGTNGSHKVISFGLIIAAPRMKGNVSNKKFISGNRFNAGYNECFILMMKFMEFSQCGYLMHGFMSNEITYVMYA